MVPIMKVATDTKPLAGAVAQVTKICSPNPGPVTANGMLVNATDNHLSLTCWDGDSTFATVTVPAETHEPGQVLVPARLARDIAPRFPDGTVEISTTSDTMTRFVSGRADFEIHTLPVEGFPQVPEPSPDIIRVDADEFIEGLREVATAKSNDDSRPVLTTVVVDSADGKVQFVATDSYRLAYRVSTAETDLTSQLMIPGPAVDWIARLGDSPDMTLHSDGTRLHVVTGTSRLAVALMAGDYPDWQRLVPDTFSATFETSAPAMLDAVKRMQLIAQAAGSAPLRCTLTETDGLIVSCDARDIGTSSEPVDGHFTGDDITVGFNGAYLAAGLANFGDHTVNIGFNGPEKPAVIRLAETPDMSGHLLMPIRL